MNIKEFAKSIGISTQAVYQRIKGAGIALDSLKEPGTQDLSEDGKKQLAQLFAKQQTTNDGLQKSLQKSLQTENEFLKQRCADLEADRDRWQRAAEQAQQLAAQAQALSLARLPAPRRSLLDWLRRKQG